MKIRSFLSARNCGSLYSNIIILIIWVASFTVTNAIFFFRFYSIASTSLYIFRNFKNKFISYKKEAQ